MYVISFSIDRYDTNIQMVSYGTNYNKHVLTWKKRGFIILEFLICSLHFPIGLSALFVGHGRSLAVIFFVLSGAMFGRIFLVFRTLTLHSNLNTGPLNMNIKVDFAFVMRYLMISSPGKVIGVGCLMLIFTLSFFMHACESFFDDNTDNLCYIDAFWLVSVTFLTIGYGDFAPVTICGRTVSLVSGLLGITITAILVLITSNKLKFTRSQKQVACFIRDAELNKKRESAAANIVKNAWMVHKYEKCQNFRRAAKFRCKYHSSVKDMAEIQEERIETKANSLELFEIHTEQLELSQQIEELKTRQINLEAEMLKGLQAIHKKLDKINSKTVYIRDND